MVSTRKERLPVVSEHKLPANKTWPFRTFDFRRFTNTGFLVTGVLMVDERKTKLGKWNYRRYCVQEIYDKTQSGRVFKFTKPLDKDPLREEVYFVNHDKSKVTCGCRAFDKGMECVHAQTITTLMRAGELPIPRPDVDCRLLPQNGPAKPRTPESRCPRMGAVERPVKVAKRGRK